jgi:hypothetical protein
VSRNELTVWKAEAEARKMSFSAYLLAPRRKELARKLKG